MFHATAIQLALVLELDARLVVFVTGFGIEGMLLWY